MSIVLLLCYPHGLERLRELSDSTNGRKKVAVSETTLPNIAEVYSLVSPKRRCGKSISDSLKRPIIKALWQVSTISSGKFVPHNSRVSFWRIWIVSPGRGLIKNSLHIAFRIALFYTLNAWLASLGNTRCLSLSKDFCLMLDHLLDADSLCKFWP